MGLIFIPTGWWLSPILLRNQYIDMSVARSVCIAHAALGTRNQPGFHGKCVLGNSVNHTSACLGHRVTCKGSHTTMRWSPYSTPSVPPISEGLNGWIWVDIGVDMGGLGPVFSFKLKTMKCPASKPLRRVLTCGSRGQRGSFTKSQEFGHYN